MTIIISFKFITMFCGTDNIVWNVPSLNTNDEIPRKILLVPLNIVMNMNNVIIWSCTMKSARCHLLVYNHIYLFILLFM